MWVHGASGTLELAQAVLDVDDLIEPKHLREHGARGYHPSRLRLTVCHHRVERVRRDVDEPEKPLAGVSECRLCNSASLDCTSGWLCHRMAVRFDTPAAAAASLTAEPVANADTNIAMRVPSGVIKCRVWTAQGPNSNGPGSRWSLSCAGPRIGPGAATAEPTPERTHPVTR